MLLTERIRFLFFCFFSGLVLVGNGISVEASPFSSVAVEPVSSKQESSPTKPTQINELTQWRWDFNTMNDSEGWTIPDSINGGIIGGAIWLTIQQGKKNIAPLKWQQQVWGANLKYDLVSPNGLAIPAIKVNKVRLRLLNLSAETDGRLFGRTVESPNKDAGSVRFTMNPDCMEWQEVTCHVDGRWQGTIDQIRIRPAYHWWRGDMWIDWIAITDGPPRASSPRPDLCSEQVIPQIQLPGITQQDFQDAFKVLDECLVVDVPMHGFNYPFLAPGGIYGENWWQLDGSLNLAGAKWVNQKFAENAMRGFAEVQAQNPDGRIDLWGGSPVRGQAADVSSIPRFFEAAYDIARRTGDVSLRAVIYHSMKKYLDYWFSPAKRNQQTGLIKALFEETFGHPHDTLGSVVPVDLNVAVAVGCHNTSLLAECLGKLPEAELYRAKYDEMKESINRYLWSEADKAYYNYDILRGEQIRRLICSTFDPMRLGIATPERALQLVSLLQNPALFDWGGRPVTSIAKTEPDFVEAVGPYDGRAWFGDVWTMRNLPIIEGLENIGFHNLAAELNWSSIQTFNGKYCEYVVPSTGSGEGVQRYGWTASQYIQAIIEHLFGIDYDCMEARLRIFPHIPGALMGKEISISNLIIPTKSKCRLDLKLTQTAPGLANMAIAIHGKLPEGTVEVLLPRPERQEMIVRDREGKKLPVVREAKGLTNVAGVRLAMRRSVDLRFE